MILGEFIYPFTIANNLYGELDNFDNVLTPIKTLFSSLLLLFFFLLLLL